jgi:hypothetical protein
LFSGPVTIEEKVDGSQFSFGVFGGEIKCRSKGQQLSIVEPDGMFKKAVESVKERSHLLRDGWVYRGEYLQSPRHNCLRYNRTPVGYIILFDVSPTKNEYLSAADKAAEAARIGLESVPVYFEGDVHDRELLASFLDCESVLGGVKIEGFVVKNYEQQNPDGEVLLAKYVSDRFKEAHHVKKTVSGVLDRETVIDAIIRAFKTEARWAKAVSHLRDTGQLKGAPEDIGPLLKEVQSDIRKECLDEITQALLEWALPQVMKGVGYGFADWYKNALLESALEVPA